VYGEREGARGSAMMVLNNKTMGRLPSMELQSPQAK